VADRRSARRPGRKDNGQRWCTLAVRRLRIERSTIMSHDNRMSHDNWMPWPGFEPGCLAALPPQSGGNGLASSAIMGNGRACRWFSEEQAVPMCLMRRNGDRIPGAKRGPTASGET